MDIAYNIWPRCTIVGFEPAKVLFPKYIAETLPLNYIGVSDKTTKIQFINPTLAKKFSRHVKLSELTGTAGIPSLEIKNTHSAPIAKLA